MPCLGGLQALLGTFSWPGTRCSLYWACCVHMSSMSLELVAGVLQGKSYTDPESKHHSVCLSSVRLTKHCYPPMCKGHFNHRTLESSSSTQTFLYIFPVLAACFENHIEHRLSTTPLCGGTTGRASLPSQFAGSLGVRLKAAATQFSSSTSRLYTLARHLACR